jgi:uncharacterized repeat protein (TIGR02543 family)
MARTITYDDVYPTFITPERAGYTFLGWFTDPNNGTQVFTGNAVNRTSDQTLYAHWEPNVYRTYFNNNTPIPSNVNLLRFNNDISTTQKNIYLEYNFTSGVFYANRIAYNSATDNGDISQFFTIPCEIKAGHTYTLSCEYLGGSIVNGCIVAEFSDNPTSEPRFWLDITSTNSKKFYAIKDINEIKLWGWCNGSYLNIKDFKFKLKIEESSTATKSSPAAIDVTYDTYIYNLPIPSRPGYKFLGWYTQPSGG